MNKFFILIILLSVVVFTGCQDKKSDQAIEQNQTTVDSTKTQDKGKLLFTINGRAVYEKDARINNISSAVNDEILYESAIMEGIDKDPSVLRSLKFHKRNVYLGLLKRKIIQSYLETHQVTMEEVEQHYNNNLSKYTILDLIVITAPDLETAQSIKTNLTKGASLESITDKYKKSEDKIKVKKFKNSKSFNDKFDKFEVGLISDPIDQKSKFKIVKITKVNTAPLDIVSKTIRYELANKLKFKAVQEHIEKLKSDNRIKIEMASE